MLEIIISIIAVAFAIWAIVDVARNKIKLATRIVWFAVVILLPVIGPLVYYFFGRNG